MIYLDSGATTMEKPPSVAWAMAHAVGEMSSPGRGNYPASQKAMQTAFSCREAAAELFGVPSPEQVVFTSNATHGLNIAIRTLVRPGCRVAVSGYEHNAVTRVLHSIPGVEIVVIDAPLFRPEKMLEGFQKALRRGVDVVICNHVSNVFGCIQPVEELAMLCKKFHTPLIVDASQSAGILPVSLSAWEAAFVAMPGHKGLYGPQGVGLLLCGQKARPLLCGGTGSASRLPTMPADLPDRLEAGTHNMPGIAGLLEGIKFVRRTGPERIALREKRLTRRASVGLSRLPGVEIFTDENDMVQTGVLSFRVKGVDSELIGEELAKRQIAVRAGLHCAPLAHRTAGTLETGTVRISPSVFNTEMHIDIFLREVGSILRENTKKTV